MPGTTLGLLPLTVLNGAPNPTISQGPQPHLVPATVSASLAASVSSPQSRMTFDSKHPLIVAVGQASGAVSPVVLAQGPRSSPSRCFRGCCARRLDPLPSSALPRASAGPALRRWVSSARVRVSPVTVPRERRGGSVFIPALRVTHSLLLVGSDFPPPLKGRGLDPPFGGNVKERCSPAPYRPARRHE